jgi:23S rRNA pseudouridine1911/1915/1917 synthase
MSDETAGGATKLDGTGTRDTGPGPIQPGAVTHSILAGAAAEGVRLDRFLAGALATLSRSRLKGLIEAGQVSRDGVTLREPAEPARVGARYDVRLPAVVAATPQAQSIRFPILFEDHDILVLDKPAGLVVHPAPGNADGTLVNALIAHCGDDFAIGGEQRPGIVHRLDKDTSGVMVVAKTEPALAALSAAFAARENLDRAYLALVWGRPMPAAGDIAGAIGRDPRERKRMAIVTNGGKPALTHYRTLGFHGIATTLLECRLATGRTHQIRVHLAGRGTPVVGDPVYLRRIPAAARALPEPLQRTLLDFPRQALHAARLGFRHPRTGEALVFETPPPADMQALLDALGMAKT